MDYYRIEPGAKIKLEKLDARDTSRFDGDKGEGKEILLGLNEKLSGLQELLFAQHQHKLLIVLQGMDTSGKDGTIRHVFKYVNPQGVRVASFKAPTPLELDRDYLWRVHHHVPGKGEIVIFNRSHYEDIIVPAVHGALDEQGWTRRCRQINDFERMLVEEGVTLLKFFLHIDADEQWDRLRARIDDPQKRWKLHPEDFKSREKWPQYIEVYQKLLAHTGTEWASWYVVPANRKWYRNLVIASLVVEILEGFDMSYPEPGDLPV